MRPLRVAFSVHLNICKGIYFMNTICKGVFLMIKDAIYPLDWVLGLELVEKIMKMLKSVRV